MANSVIDRQNITSVQFLIDVVLAVTVVVKPRRQRQRKRCQTKGLMSRTIAEHVRFVAVLWQTTT